MIFIKRRWDLCGSDVIIENNNSTSLIFFDVCVYVVF